MIFIEKQCRVCKIKRKFIQESGRDLDGVCGECHNWNDDPKYIKFTKDEEKQLKGLLSYLKNRKV